MINISSKIASLTSTYNSNLSQQLQSTSTVAREREQRAEQQRWYNNATQKPSEENSDAMMNQIGLAIQRQGGQ